jgi:ribonuclease BN (tRNA processing enzyme)
LSARITFVGSGDAFAAGGRFQACLHLQADGVEPLLLDCGATSLVALRRLELDPSSLGYIALSHLHGDHFGGLPWLILDGQFAGRTRPLQILGPPGTQPRVNHAFEALYPGAANAERAFETRFVEFSERTAQGFGPANITAYPVVHTPATAPHALRIQYAGTTIAYSGDTEWTDALIEASADADVFICECNFLDKKAPGHLDYETLMQNRDRLRTRRIVLTHMSQRMLSHAGEVELEMAYDGAVIDI